MSFLTRARPLRLSLTRRTCRTLDVRLAHNSAKPRRITYGRVGLASGVLLGGSLLVLGNTTDGGQTSIRDANRPTDEREPPLSSLIRSYAVYTICSIPLLVDWSPTILETLMTIPVIRNVTEAFGRITFFAQFVGGDTALEVVPLLEQLRAENKGGLFAYSVEVDEKATYTKSEHSSEVPPHKKAVEEMLRSIDVAADFDDANSHGGAAGRTTWVAVKMTALLPDAQSLINWSAQLINVRPTAANPIAFPGTPLSSDLELLQSKSLPPVSRLTQDDVAAIIDLHADLVKISQRAQERGVKLIVDAEYSWYQPAIDALTLSLSYQFNKLSSRLSRSTTSVQPLIYGTYQAYLRRTPEHLAQSLQDAKSNNYALGVKLVRGAYIDQEIAAHPSTSATSRSKSISPDSNVPVWTEKQQTDDCYNTCARLLIREVEGDIQSGSKKGGYPGIGVLFGTHNWESCDIILKELSAQGLVVSEKEADAEIFKVGADVSARVMFGQLYGMSDALTDSIVARTVSASPFVVKYVPYGALADVMPYLSRRAVENKSVLGGGGAALERRRAGEAIWKRLFG